MKMPTKVMLSPGELATAADKQIILTKLAVMETAANLFAAQVPFIDEAFGKAVKQHSLNIPAPKITRGENYKKLPYVLLDYPATFSRENIFAVRSLFWWGNFISINLHISGAYKETFNKKLYNNLMAAEANIFICVNEKQWEHHFEEDNYKAVVSLTTEEKDKIFSGDFVKVAIKYELHQWNLMQQLLPAGYKKLADLLEG